MNTPSNLLEKNKTGSKYVFKGDPICGTLFDHFEYFEVGLSDLLPS